VKILHLLVRRCNNWTFRCTTASRGTSAGLCLGHTWIHDHNSDLDGFHLCVRPAPPGKMHLSSYIPPQPHCGRLSAKMNEDGFESLLKEAGVGR
jgi:hypothetical protein